MNPYHRLLPLLAILWLAGCATMAPHREIEGEVSAQKAQAEVPEGQLLDVWIEVFDPGELPEDSDEASGLSVDIREAEARYMAEHLRDTMEQTGYWGAVRVVPRDTSGAELLVRGTILASDGEQLKLRIQARDASGREWLDGSYESEVTAADYLSPERPQRDVFQSLYNAIANDLARFRGDLSPDEIVTVRRIAALRFAADLAPDAFGAYVRRNDAGEYRIVRLPALDDPMYRRVSAIRSRDFLLIDTLNGHFDNFSREVQEPYTEWRRSRSEEAAALREIRSAATKRKLLGAMAILGAIALEAAGSNSTRQATGGLRNAMWLGGAYAIKTGIDKDSETGIHRDAIEELGASFASETRPLVVEVEGEVHELNGSAEEQYAEWRALLKRIYQSETGLAGAGERD
jgi:hypothetical protein